MAGGMKSGGAGADMRIADGGTGPEKRLCLRCGMLFGSGGTGGAGKARPVGVMGGVVMVAASLVVGEPGS